MFKARGNIYIVGIFILALFISFSYPAKNKIIGHWTTQQDLYSLEIGDTVELQKTSSNKVSYTWGGSFSGMEFQKDSSFIEHKNTLCSTESSNVRYENEKWWMINNNTIKVYGLERTLTFYIIKITNKQITLKCLQQQKY